MSSFNYIGEGTALVVREKCESIITFTSKTTITTTSNPFFFVINYENSIIGKQLLSWINRSDTIVASNTSLASNSSYIFIFNFYQDSSGLIFFVTAISGDYKKCNYSSGDIQLYVPSVTSKDVNDQFKLHVKSADEFNKLLKSNSNLNTLYLKLIKK
jgi:hypothetical protein